MESPQRLSRVDAKVRRDGQIRQIPAEALVHGDVVFLEGGDKVKDNRGFLG